MKRTLQEAARVVGGSLAGEDRPYGAVSTDSRTLAAGALFVALKGPNFDGGQFVAAAARSTMAPTAPRSRAAPTNCPPSNVGPRKAMNRAPAVSVRLSVDTAP